MSDLTFLSGTFRGCRYSIVRARGQQVGLLQETPTGTWEAQFWYPWAERPIWPRFGRQPEDWDKLVIGVFEDEMSAQAAMVQSYEKLDEDVRPKTWLTRAEVTAALEVARRYGGTDEAHHKDWVIDQMVRALTGDQYETWVAETCDGEDGPETYSWEVGIEIDDEEEI